MIYLSDVGWGNYLRYAGPIYLGTKKFSDYPAEETESYKRLAVITATEGGAFDAINMYDRCIISAGLIQWCEAGMFGTSNLLGAIAEKHPEALAADHAVHARCKEVGYQFQKVNGNWRFCTSDGAVVDTLVGQRRLFLYESDGTKTLWDPESVLYAKLWVSAIGNVLANPTTFATQVTYTSDKLMSLVMPSAKAILFEETGYRETPLADDPTWLRVAQVAFLSYSANLPSVAAKQLAKHNIESRCTDPANWVYELLRRLTFDSGVAIYPARYRTIRPVIERLYSVNLPAFGIETRDWASQENVQFTDPHAVKLDTVEGIQQVLLKLRYDLGPKGADGVYGRKTRAAVTDFQTRHGLTVDGVVGPRTRAALLAVALGSS